jgi:hypothetical protein
VAARSNAGVCGRSLAGIAGSNLAGGHGCLVSCEFCVLSGSGLCDEPIPFPEKSYRVCVRVCVNECAKAINNPLHLQCVGRSQTKRERKEIKDEITKAFKTQGITDECIGLRSF